MKKVFVIHTFISSYTYVIAWYLDSTEMRWISDWLFFHTLRKTLIYQHDIRKEIFMVLSLVPFSRAL